MFSPDELASNRIDLTDEHGQPLPWVVEILSEEICHAWAQGYTETGRHALIVGYEAFAPITASLIQQQLKHRALRRHAQLGPRCPASCTCSPASAGTTPTPTKTPPSPPHCWQPATPASTSSPPPTPPARPQPSPSPYASWSAAPSSSPASTPHPSTLWTPSTRSCATASPAGRT
ncbi:hypothetical protein [Streptomyces phaeoluteigriseus]